MKAYALAQVRAGRTLRSVVKDLAARGTNVTFQELHAWCEAAGMPIEIYPTRRGRPVITHALASPLPAAGAR